MSDVAAVVGAQYGSEGKGVIVAHLADQFDVHVRTGGPNAGHSFLHHGKVWKMQALPVGWRNPNARLVIGRGAVVSLRQLAREVRQVERAGYDVVNRLFIDAGAALLLDRHAAEEGGTGGKGHRDIGSTGEGVGAARMDYMRRIPGSGLRVIDALDAEWWLSSPEAEMLPLKHLISDTVSELGSARRDGQAILLEGTQGTGLSLIHGHWPFVTSHDTTAGQLAVDAGIPPVALTEVILVARTMPIRVAGNSGPLANETNWEDVSQKLGRQVIEHTTVTKKTRRIAEWDDEMFLRACTLNGPTSIALTFADYMDANMRGETSPRSISPKVARFIEYLEIMAGCRVTMVGTGGTDSWNVIDR